MNNELTVNPIDYGLTENQAELVAKAFIPMSEKMKELEDEYNVLVSHVGDSEPSESDCDDAKALRLQYVKIRTGVDKIHKSQKAFYLSGGRFVDGWKNAHKHASGEKEERLKDIEFFRQV